MTWKNLNYATKGAIIGGLIGLVGSILRSFFLSMNSDTFFIFGIPGIVLRIVGIGRCNWKSSFCPVDDFLGYIVTVIVFSLIGFFIGFIVKKLKSKK